MIFEREKQDGLEEAISNNSVVAFCSPVSLSYDTKALAEKEEVQSKDLYYLEAVLVSTGWNKNDDVFLPERTWAARNTPVDKQFNFMHNENDIIGHIIGSYVLTKDGVRINDDQETHPEDFDIITKAVLYNTWTEEENRSRMEKIIAEINEGKWFVSMECMFSSFDYALTDSSGKSKVLARNEESAFLTKHLRAFGGTGEYQGYKVGRALGDISFSGKGLVYEPANPRSVILKGQSVASFNVNEADFNLSIGEVNMSDVTLLQKQLDEKNEELSKAMAAIEAAKAKAEEAKDKEYTLKLESYEAKANEDASKIDELQESIKSAEARIAELESALTDRQNELASAKEEMDKMKKMEKMRKRKAALLEAGLEEGEVEETLASLETLDDDSFDSVAKMMKKKGYKKDKEEEDSEASAGVLDDVETDNDQDVSLSLDNDEDDDLQKTIASVSEFFSKSLSQK